MQKMRNFWSAWRDEYNHLRENYTAEDGAPAPLPRAEIHRAWREFFRAHLGNEPESHWLFKGRRFTPWQQGNEDFNPFVSTLLSRGGGLLPVYVLHLLAQKPRYGNEIMTTINGRTGGQWQANPGAIYPLMMQLENRGFISGEWEDPHKRTTRIYKMPPKGLEELENLKAILIPKLNAASEVLASLAADLVEKPKEDMNLETITNKGDEDEHESKRI